MVGNRARGSKRHQQPRLDENGHPIMQGVDMSFAEDPAGFWGARWKEELESAEEEYQRSPKHVFNSLDDLIADLDAAP